MELVVNIWKGKLPLWKVFWLYGLGGAVLFGFVDQVLGSGMKQGAVSPLVALPVVAVMVSYFTIVFVGVWRSATNYAGKLVWAVLAKFVAVIKLMQVAGVVGTLMGLNK